jgi:3-oxoacyl-(acyl-carrier-protein) synthase
MNRRVVITGMGVVAPNAVGVPMFLDAIRQGRSGIQFNPLFRELQFNCQVWGHPDFNLEDIKDLMSETIWNGLKGMAIAYAIKVAAEAWTDAGFDMETEEPLWDTGCVFGSSVSDFHLLKRVIEQVEKKEARKLGSRVVEQVMNSGPAAYISGLLGLGNRIIAPSSACATGTQAILMGYECIKTGGADRMIVGSCESLDPYIIGAFDSMRVLSWKYNDSPSEASRPMSASSCGFVPGSGAGALVLEDLESAQKRNARIYAEVLGGATNTGGQRGGGSMTAPNFTGIVRCITQALQNAQVKGDAIDLISGHLTATFADKFEIRNWATALNRQGEDFPLVNSVKSLTGHCLSAAGAIETIAAVLQIYHQFVHPNLNVQDPHPEIQSIIGRNSLPLVAHSAKVDLVAKANFGFGDVNACLILSSLK